MSVGPDRLGDHAVRRPGVELEHEPERRRAGLGVAGQHGVLHRGGPAPARQHGEVQVHEAVPRDVQHPLRQQRPVRHHRAAVRRDLGQPGHEVLVARPLRLEHLEAQLLRRAAATGLAVSRLPRPLGASGRVTTATTSWSEATSASRAGTATSGVPQKTMRTAKSTSLGRARPGRDGQSAQPAQPRTSGSTRTRTAPSLLRALRTPATSLAARTRARPSRTGARRVSRSSGSPSLPGSCVAGRQRRPGRASRCRAAAGPGRRTPASASAAPSTVTSLAAGGKWASARSASSRAGEPGRVDPDQRLQRPPRALPHRDHRAAVGPAADQRDHVEPAPQRLLRGPQVGRAAAAAGCPAARRRRSRPRPAARPPGVATTMAGASGTGPAHLRRSTAAPAVAGERPAQLLRRPLRPDHGRPQRRDAADRALPVDLRPAAPAAGQRPSARARRRGVVGPPQNRQRTGSRQSWQTSASQVAGPRAPGPAPGPAAAPRASARTPRAAAGRPGRPGRAPGRGRRRR